MKKLLLLLILSFLSAQGLAGECPDGSEPVKSISDDGSYFVFNCEGGNKKAASSNTNINVGPVSINIHDEYHYNNFPGLVSLDFAFAIRTGFWCNIVIMDYDRKVFVSRKREVSSSHVVMEVEIT